MKDTLDSLDPFFLAVAVFVVSVAIAPSFTPQPFSLKHPPLDLRPVEQPGEL